MSDTERVYSLYVQANPVPDPGLLPETVTEAELLTIERSRTMDTQQRPDVRATPPPTRWRTALIAFAAIILVVAAVAGTVALIGDGDDVLATADAAPTLTFDGETATYSGPEEFRTDEEVTFTLENNSDRPVTFGWNRMNDESVTLEEEIAWMETHRGTTYQIPQWVEDYGALMVVMPDAVLEQSAAFETGKGLLYVWDATNRILYPAAHIIVVTN